MGDFRRRQDEWDLQIELAGIELKQLERQQIGAEIRLAIAERELQNHDLQTENARDVDRFMRDKFTNADFFSWMVGQTSAVYFQTYQLAFDTAKQAERCLAVRARASRTAPILHPIRILGFAEEGAAGRRAADS